MSFTMLRHAHSYIRSYFYKILFLSLDSIGQSYKSEGLNIYLHNNYRINIQFVCFRIGIVAIKKNILFIFIFYIYFKKIILRLEEWWQFISFPPSNQPIFFPFLLLCLNFCLKLIFLFLLYLSLKKNRAHPHEIPSQKPIICTALFLTSPGDPSVRPIHL